MNRITVILLTCTILFSCAQGGNKQNEPGANKDSINAAAKPDHSIQKGDQTTAPQAPLTETQKQCAILNSWIGDATGSRFEIDTAAFTRSNLGTAKNYEEKATAAFKEKLNFRLDSIKPEMEVSDGSVKLEFTNEDFCYERFLLLNDKVIYSYHAGAGDDKRCIMYNLLTKEEKEFPFTFSNVKNNVGEINTDGYDKSGHFWKKGTYDLKTGKTTWSKNEY